jgi:hypothetical protein
VLCTLPFYYTILYYTAKADLAASTVAPPASTVGPNLNRPMYGVEVGARG